MFQSSFINDTFYKVPVNLVPMSIVRCDPFKEEKSQKYNSVGSHY